MTKLDWNASEIDITQDADTLDKFFNIGAVNKASWLLFEVIVHRQHFRKNEVIR